MYSRLIIIVCVLFAASHATAYIGPGLGLGAVGVILGAILAVFLAILGLFWYPIKRVLGLGKKNTDAVDDEEESQR